MTDKLFYLSENEFIAVQRIRNNPLYQGATPVEIVALAKMRAKGMTLSLEELRVSKAEVPSLEGRSEKVGRHQLDQEVIVDIKSGRYAVDFSFRRINPELKHSVLLVYTHDTPPKLRRFVVPNENEPLLKLGEGTRGGVKLAFDIDELTWVAVKSQAIDQRYVHDQALLEDKTLKAIGAYIGNIYFAIDQEIAYKNITVMEWIKGPSLRKKLGWTSSYLEESFSRFPDQIPLRDHINYLRQIVEAVSAFHDKGFIHRDLNFNNIIFDEAHRKMVLVDFGLAVKLPDNESVYLETVGMYGPLMPPETENDPDDAQRYSVATDVYTLGFGMNKYWNALKECFAYFSFVEDPQINDKLEKVERMILGMHEQDPTQRTLLQAFLPLLKDLDQSIQGLKITEDVLPPKSAMILSRVTDRTVLQKIESDIEQYCTRVLAPPKGLLYKAACLFKPGERAATILENMGQRLAEIVHQFHEEIEALYRSPAPLTRYQVVSKPSSSARGHDDSDTETLSSEVEDDDSHAVYVSYEADAELVNSCVSKVWQLKKELIGNFSEEVLNSKDIRVQQLSKFIDDVFSEIDRYNPENTVSLSDDSSKLSSSESHRARLGY